MKEKIKKVVAQALNTEVTDSSSQSNCAAWDSLHHLNLVIELEEEFDVSFEIEEIAQMKSIEAIESILKTKV
jgi:acyl carrier protein